jgi:hypothetical protein
MVNAKAILQRMVNLFSRFCAAGADPRQVGLAESQAAAVKQSKIKIEKTIGTIKAYFRHTIVIAAKQMTSAHAVPRRSAKV